MKLHEKADVKRYRIYAKRKGSANWTEWTHADDEGVALSYMDKVLSLGFDAKMTDRENKNKVVRYAEQTVS